MKLIISPYIGTNDKDAINLLFNEEITKNIINEMFLNYLHNEEKIIASAELLFILLKLEKLEIKVAEPLNNSGLFHEKTGVFKDLYNNSIAIIGSNNETRNALNFNIESFNTFCSWKTGQEEYVDDHIADFNNYWTGSDENIRLYDLREALDLKILKKFNTDKSIDKLFEIILDTQEEVEYKWSINPRDYQKEAVDEWFKFYKGIIKFATGTGKTKTAIYLMEKLENEKDKNFFVIVVPDKTLVNQWSDELESYEKNVIRCYSETNNWHIELKDTIELASIEDKYNYYFVITNNSFITDRFQRELSKLKEDYLLVVDECHTWGSNTLINLLPKSDRILALSATPELHFSEYKTKKLFDYFGGIIAEYSLKKAIKDDKLVPYYYFPHIVQFSDSERYDYREETKKIIKMIGRDISDLSDSIIDQEIVQRMLFKRARIAYGAINKIEKLEELLVNMENKDNLLIYSGPTSYADLNLDDVDKESITQLEVVNSLLRKLNIRSTQYTSQENEKQRKIALNNFKDETYSVLSAIKCLDEGIDIPQIKTAIILSSSTNPREFVQRRGRILRKHYNKEYAVIHDFIIIEDEFESLVKKELERFMEFSELSINKEELLEEFDEIIREYRNGEKYDE